MHTRVISGDRAGAHTAHCALCACLRVNPQHANQYRTEYDMCIHHTRARRSGWWERKKGKEVIVQVM